MCIVAVALKQIPQYPFVVIANREEFYDRPTAAATFWSPDEEQAPLLGGRDLLQQGTWLGITKSGRFSAVTNFRAPGSEDASKKSRGCLPIDFLRSCKAPTEFILKHVVPHANDYRGFNLLLYSGGEASHYCNVDGNVNEWKTPGVHCVSNGPVMDGGARSWPKVDKLKSRLGELLRTFHVPSVRQKWEYPSALAEQLFELLLDETIADDVDLPSTGVSLERERGLSSILVRLDGYGTRCSTVVLVDKDGVVNFWEKTYPVDTYGSVPDGKRRQGEQISHFSFLLEKDAS